MESVLVSACLLGEAVRYDGGHKRCDHEVLWRWAREGRTVSVCPELLGGLPVPRLPAEIGNGKGGPGVIAGSANVFDSKGFDVTAFFMKGAEETLSRARSLAVRVAVLKEGSPSCGSGYVYDGTFSGIKVPFPGVTTELLRRAGIYVFGEAGIHEADRMIKDLEAESSS